MRNKDRVWMYFMGEVINEHVSDLKVLDLRIYEMTF